MISILSKALPLSLLTLVTVLVAATGHASTIAGEPKAAICQKTISIHCGKTPSAILSQDGRLWVAFVQGQYVYVANSENMGVDFSMPVRANAVPEPVYTNGENRPKIALGPEGNIYLSWTKITEGRFSGDIRFTRSTDGGLSFDPVTTINDDGLTTSHRFDQMIVTPAGTIYLAWLDKRDKVEAADEYRGSAVYFSVSKNQGLKFGPNQKVVDHSCECCRLAMAPAEGESVAVMWRHMFGVNTRDHAIAQLNADGSSEYFSRASFDEWQVDACPHHGPDISAAGNGIYHLAWFSNGEKNQGIYYGQYDLRNQTQLVSKAMDQQPSASHPQVVGVGDSVYFLWKRFDGENTHIDLTTTDSSAREWSPVRSIASTDMGSDHPLIVQYKTQVYVSWHTDAGYRFFEIRNDPKQ